MNKIPRDDLVLAKLEFLLHYNTWKPAIEFS